MAFVVVSVALVLQVVMKALEIPELKLGEQEVSRRRGAFCLEVVLFVVVVRAVSE